MALFDFVQEAHQSINGNNTATVTMTLTAGNFLVAQTLGNNAGNTVSDGVNTWVDVYSTGVIYYALNVAGGSTTINAVPLAGVGSNNLQVIELEGSASVIFDSPGEEQTSYLFPGSYTSLDSGVLAVSAAAGLVGILYFNFASSTLTEDTNFTQRSYLTDSNWVVGFNLGTRTVGSAGNYNYVPTATAGNNFSTSTILAFIDGGGGGGTTWPGYQSPFGFYRSWTKSVTGLFIPPQVSLA